MRSSVDYLLGAGPLITGRGAYSLNGTLKRKHGLDPVWFSLRPGGGLALRKAWTPLTHAMSIQVANGQVEDVEGKATAGSGNQSFYMLTLAKRETNAWVPVSERLADNDEADWLADRIQEAAEQQASSG